MRRGPLPKRDDRLCHGQAPLEVIENLEEIEDEGDIYESIEDIWPDYPSKDVLSTKSIDANRS